MAEKSRTAANRGRAGAQGTDKPSNAGKIAGKLAGSDVAAVAQKKQTACTPEQIEARKHRKPVNLALQGGGTHGAFTWGVLDKLLEDDRLALDAISATSAGAMNAAVMAYGMSQGGREGARQALDRFWREISHSGGVWNPFKMLPWDKMLAGTPFGGNAVNGTASPMFMMFDALTHVLSPYQLNPLNFNPLRDVLERVVDFDKLAHSPHATRLFISATNVRTGKIRVFENAEITVDAIMASACLPYIFRAVQIGGEHYWDGGFMGNPAIFPLIYNGASNDVVVVHVNPLVRKNVPRTASEIFDRMNEISFNSSLMREMRAIAFVSRLLDEEKLDAERYSRMRIHAIRNEEEMSKFGLETKLEPDWDLISALRDIGRQTAQSWLDENFDHVGHKTTVDMVDMYL